MDTYDEMVEAAATRFALLSGWTFPQPIHKVQAREVLDASGVPKLLERMVLLEDSHSRTFNVLTWALDQVTQIKDGVFAPSEYPPELEAGDIDGSTT